MRLLLFMCVLSALWSCKHPFYDAGKKIEKSGYYYCSDYTSSVAKILKLETNCSGISDVVELTRDEFQKYERGDWSYSKTGLKANLGSVSSDEQVPQITGELRCTDGDFGRDFKFKVFIPRTEVVESSGDQDAAERRYRCQGNFNFETMCVPVFQNSNDSMWIEAEEDPLLSCLSTLVPS